VSFTVLAGVALALAFVAFVMAVGLCVVVWHHAKAIHKGYSFNQWENALYEQWREQEPDVDRLAGIEARLNVLVTTVEDLVNDVYPKADKPGVLTQE
jgi:hypothetical protein